MSGTRRQPRAFYECREFEGSRWYSRGFSASGFRWSPPPDPAPSTAHTDPLGVVFLLARAGEARSGSCRRGQAARCQITHSPTRAPAACPHRQVPDVLRCPSEEKDHPAPHHHDPSPARKPHYPPPPPRSPSEGPPEAPLTLTFKNRTPHEPRSDDPTRTRHQPGRRGRRRRTSTHPTTPPPAPAKPRTRTEA